MRMATASAISMASVKGVADARFMLKGALADPNPVIIFEHVMLHNMESDLSSDVTGMLAGHPLEWPPRRSCK